MTDPDRSHVHESAIVDPGVVIGNGVSIDAFAVVKSGERPTRLENECDIGPHSTVQPGVVIGHGAQVLGNSLVVDDVPPMAIVAGVPAVITGYRDAMKQHPARVVVASHTRAHGQLGVGRSELVPLPSFRDLRGALVVGEFDELPFVPNRMFVVHDVHSGHVRGAHAHHRCEQLLIAASGVIRCIVDDGTDRVEVVLDTPGVGLLIPALTWGTQFGHSRDASLLVLASLPYDDADYLREYHEFLEARRLAAHGDR